MEKIIKFAYTGYLSWDNENLLDLIKVADYLGIDALKEKGIKCLQSSLNPLQAIHAYHLSCTWNNTSLKKKSKKIILQNFEILSETNEFLNLNINLFKDILSNDFQIHPTEKIFEGIVKWILENIEERKLHLEDIFKLIHYGRADINMILRIIADKKLLTSSSQHK